MPLSCPTYQTQELVEAIRNKNLQAMEFLYDYYAGALFCCILQTLPDKEEAEKVLEQSFLAVWTRIASYNSKDRFFTWVILVTKNEMTQALQQKEEHQKRASGMQRTL